MKPTALLMASLGAAPALGQVTPFTVAHLSDAHISASAPARDTALKAAIAEINALSPQPGLIIETGDMTEMGAEEEFVRYKADVALAKMPLKATPGNHETRWADKSINRFIEHFGSPNISFLQNGVRFIGFNAAIWLEHHGAVSGDTRRWIVDQLKQDPKGTPAVLFCHQPPMYPDNVYMTGDVELWEAIAPYNVRLFLNGHGHIFKSWTVNGVFCHMTKGMMNDAGGYSLYAFSTTNVKVYEKPMDGTRRLVATVPLVPERVAVSLTPGERTEARAAYTAQVTSEGPVVSRVEWQVDHHEHPEDSLWSAVTRDPAGDYPFAVPLAGLAPGRHTVAVRAVDSAGGIWITTLPLDAAGAPTARSAGLGTALQGPAAVDADRIYVGGWDGALHALDRATLAPAWTFATGGPVVMRPDADTEAVYFGSTDTNVYALNKATGALIWKLATGGPIQGHALVADGAVFVASGDHSLYAIDCATGRKRWSYTMNLHAQARPAYLNGVVYVGAWDNNLYAIDARTGLLRWKAAIGSIINYAPAVTSPCAVEGRVIVTAAVPPGPDQSPNVRCYDAATGALLWGRRLVNGASPYGSPASDGRRVYCVTLDGTIHALSITDGASLWQSAMGDGAYDCQAVVHDGQVVCNTLQGLVEGHSAATGERLWSYKTGAGLTFAWPTVADGTAWQPSMDGSLTAITLPR